MVGRWKAWSEVMPSSIPAIGGSMEGVPPVAITIRSAVTVLPPTSSVCGPVKRAWASCMVTPAPPSSLA